MKKSIFITVLFIFNRIFRPLNNHIISILLSSSIILTYNSGCSDKKNELQWYRGNMHTHTLWSDGNDFPECVAKWYMENGYHFLVYTDHNIIHEGEFWKRFPEDDKILENYYRLFGEEWVVTKPDNENGYLQVRLKTYDEYQDKFQKPGEYLLMMGNEITDSLWRGVHLLAFHQDEIINWDGIDTNDKAEMISAIVRRVDNYRNRTGHNIFPVLAHPNWYWSITAEMILDVPDLRFIEVYNGANKWFNDGDRYRASTERIWDIVLSIRLVEMNGKLIYGLATDDAHHYHGSSLSPGKGWVMIRGSELTTESILNALDEGDFYASTGVFLNDIYCRNNTIHVKIEPEEGAEYLTEYIGTRKGFNPSYIPTVDSAGIEIPNTTCTYSDEIGKVLHSSNDTKSSYRFTGDELYVRVQVTSTADQVDVFSGEVIGKKKAWGQPMVPGNNKLN